MNQNQNQDRAAGTPRASDKGGPPVDQGEKPDGLANSKLTKPAPIDQPDGPVNKKPDPGGLAERNITQPAPLDSPADGQSRK